MAKLLTMLNILILPKGDSIELNKYLNSEEVQCRCNRLDCHFTLINSVHAKRFYKLRKEMSFPLTINSGFRCTTHNKFVGGVDHSSHTTGNALDISTAQLWDGQRMKLIIEARKLFDYVKVYNTFIHCQTSPRAEGGMCV